MPPPARPPINQSFGSQRQIQPLGSQNRQISTSMADPDPESLFMPAGDEDSRWDPPAMDNDDGEDMLGWDASYENPGASFQPAFQDREPAAPVAPPPEQSATQATEGLEPTQRLSQVSDERQWRALLALIFLFSFTACSIERPAQSLSQRLQPFLLTSCVTIKLVAHPAKIFETEPLT